MKLRFEVTKDGNPLSVYKFQRVVGGKTKYMVGTRTWEYRLPKFIWSRL